MRIHLALQLVIVLDNPASLAFLVLAIAVTVLIVVSLCRIATLLSVYFSGGADQPDRGSAWSFAFGFLAASIFFATALMMGA